MHKMLVYGYGIGSRIISQNKEARREEETMIRDSVLLVLILVLSLCVYGQGLRVQQLETAFVQAIYREVRMTEEQKVRESVVTFSKQYPLSKVGDSVVFTRTAQ